MTEPTPEWLVIEENGTWHIDVPGFLAALGVADTQATRDRATAIIQQVVKEKLPRARTFVVNAPLPGRRP